MNQEEIDELLKESKTSDFYKSSQVKITELEGQLSQSTQSIKQAPFASLQEVDKYDDEFESYEQSRRTLKGITENEKKREKATQLKEISEEKMKPDQKSYTEKPFRGMIKVDGLDKLSTTGMPTENRKVTRPATAKENKSAAKTAVAFIKKTEAQSKLPYNYSRMQEREKQLLFTTLHEQNQRLKIALASRDKELKTIELKYCFLREEKSKSDCMVNEKQLKREIDIWETKYCKLQSKYESLAKIHNERGSVKAGQGHDETRFITLAQAARREGELLGVIDKLKNNLIQSEKELKVLQTRLNDEGQQAEKVLSKFRRVEQLQHNLEKMMKQNQIDREAISSLKARNQQFEQKLQAHKDEKYRLQAQIKVMWIKSKSEEDTLQELNELKREKQLLEQALKSLSGTLMANVHNNLLEKRPSKAIDPEALLAPKGKM